MRDRDTIDSELRLLAAERRSIRERGGELSTSRVDELLDERLGHRPEPSEKPRQLMALRPRPSLTHGRDAMTITRSRRGRKNVFRRFGLLAALPLSLIGVATLLVVAFATVWLHWLPAVAVIDRLLIPMRHAGEVVLQALREEGREVVIERALVGLGGDDVVGALGAEGRDDFLLAAHRVEGDDGALQVE